MQVKGQEGEEIQALHRESKWMLLSHRLPYNVL